jgi:hypothetical protein
LVLARVSTSYVDDFIKLPFLLTVGRESAQNLLAPRLRSLGAKNAVMEATMKMKLIISAAVLSSFAPSPGYAQEQEKEKSQHQQEQQKQEKTQAANQQKADKKQQEEQKKRTQQAEKQQQKEPPNQKQQAEKQQRQQANQKQLEDKQQQQDQQKRQQQLAKQQQQEEKQRQKQQQQFATQERQQSNNQRSQAGAQQSSRDADHRGRRIPEDRFRASFGREHRFHVERRDDRRFQFRGYWFEFVDPWPAYWAYDDDCYIEEIDEQYYLIDVRHPEVRILVIVID